jgi:hypothetical protein
MAFQKFEIDSGAAKSDRKQVSGDKKPQVHDNQSDFVQAALHGNVLPLTFYPRSRALARDHDLVRSRDASDPAAVRG